MRLACLFTTFNLFFRYKGRIIYNTRYQESGGSSSGGASGSTSRETRRSSRYRTSSGSAPAPAADVTATVRPSTSSGTYSAPTTRSSSGSGKFLSTIEKTANVKVENWRFHRTKSHCYSKKLKISFGLNLALPFQTLSNLNYLLA
jgi:hypothetical protein